MTDMKIRMFLAGMAGFAVAVFVSRAAAAGGVHLMQSGDLLAALGAMATPSASSGVVVAAGLLAFALLRRPAS